MNKVLITGVAGLLGANFSRYLLNKGYDVVGIDNLSGGPSDFVDERLIKGGNFYKIDLINKKDLEEIFKIRQPEYVYHFAAFAAEGLSPFIRNFNYTNNLLCSINVINNCIKYDVKKLIFTSSMAVYGQGKPPFREIQTPSPVDPYGIAKYAVEMDIRQAHDQFGLNFNIVRPHNVIGVYQNIWDKYRNVIGIWIRQSLAGEPISVYGDGKQKRAFSDIKYYLLPFERLMKGNDNEIFNLGSDRKYELGEIARLVADISKDFGCSPRIEYLEKRHEVKDAFCNHDKAKKLLRFKDSTNIEATIKNMFAWAKAQPPRETKQMPYEIDKKIYSFWRSSDKSLNLKRVTLCAVACTKVQDTVEALKQSMKGINYSEVLLLTHEKLNLESYGIKVVKIKKLNYKEYNYFVAYKLKDYIKSDYCLLVQNDGYVLRPDKWDNRYFDYDYIGAPWPPGLHFTADGTNIRVGNGGFSFRSRKLLNSLSKLKLPFTDKGTGYFHEDGLYCVYYRRELENFGIKYAPVEIASKFSRESECEDSEQLSFGFHGNRNIPKYLLIRPLLKYFNVEI